MKRMKFSFVGARFLMALLFCSAVPTVMPGDQDTDHHGGGGGGGQTLFSGRAVVVDAKETHRCFRNWLLHRSNEVARRPDETAATNLRGVPIARATIRSASSHLPPKLFCNGPIPLPQNFALVVFLREAKPFAAGFPNGRKPCSKLPVGHSISSRHSNVISWFVRMKQQDARGLLVHMSGIKRQSPYRLKGNHCKEGFTADVATRTTAEDFTRSSADEQQVGYGDANLPSQCRISLTSARATNHRSRTEIVRWPLRPCFAHRAEGIRF